MSEVVCQVGNEAGQVEFIWSTRGGFFKPYVLSGTPLADLRTSVDRSRDAIEKLVVQMNDAGSGAPPWEASFKLAGAGYRLYQDLLPGGDETARKVRRWLRDLRKQPGLTGLEVVVEERSTDAKALLSVPWNLVYDEEPARAAFEKGQSTERWRPFWSVRYNLASGRRVDPLKRVPIWSDPRVIVVIDPGVREKLHEDQRARLDRFLAESNLAMVGSMDELKRAIEADYPRLLYWLGHTTDDFRLRLGDEEIAPADLKAMLDVEDRDDRDRPGGLLAFLNACETAEARSGRSFLESLHHTFGFTGAIVTEQLTIDNFANEFGLDFLQGFLREGKPLGELLHGLRLRSVPLGLLYGAHCPPEIRVRPAGEPADDPNAPPIREGGPAAGVVLGEVPARGRRKRRRDRRARQEPAATRPVVVPALPDAPYRSLDYYDEDDRALFTGRDTDVVRFAATLDRPDTRILILHGESGTGKSSFLRAGVIPYLEHECVGYRFFRKPDGKLLFVQAADDLIGGLAQALLDASAISIRFDSPDGEAHSVNLRRVLDQALGATADYATLREALRGDPDLLANLLARMAARLPHALILVLDQAEEVFTLARSREEVAVRDQGLKMLQRLVDLSADVKLIISLRTEYYGRLLDHLRAGRRDLTGVRDDLLREFSREALIEAIKRPASRTPLAPGQPSPREKYDLHYAKGIPEKIADDILDLRSENQDGVLPLVQVICTQLRDREQTQPGMDGIITLDDFDAIKGVEGGLKAFAEDALERSMHLDTEDCDAFKALFIQLYNSQPDGTLTTWLKSRESLEIQWHRPTPFAEMLKSARGTRLLREDELRIKGGEPRRYIRLGHDALARVAAAWQAEREEKHRQEREKAQRERERREQQKRFRWLLTGSLGIGCLALVLLLVGLFVLGQNQKLQVANKEAKRQERIAQLRLMYTAFSQIDNLWRTEAEKGMTLLLDRATFPSPGDRDFTWGYYFALCNRDKILAGHENSVVAVAFSPDGRTIASSSNDTMVRLWDADTGLTRATLQGHGLAVRSLAFSPDGRTLASGSWDKTVRLWDAATGAPRALTFGHGSAVESVAFSPDGRTIASSSNDTIVRLCDADTGLTRATLQGHGRAVRSLAFSPVKDSKRLASGGDDKTVRLWDTATGEPTAIPFEHGGAVLSVAFSPDGKTLASGDVDGMVWLWDVDKGKLRATFKGHEPFVWSVAFSSDGKTLASGGGDGMVRLWDAATGEPRATLKGHEEGVMSVAFSPVKDSKRLASGGGDKTVRLWYAATGEPRATLKGYKEGVLSVAFSADGKTLASGGLDGMVWLWDADKGEPRATFKGHEEGVLSVAFSPDGKTLALGGGDGMVRLWDAAKGELGATFKGHEEGVTSVAFSPVKDSKTLASGSRDKTVRLWDAGTGEPRATFKGHEEGVMSVAFSPDGKTLASSGLDGMVWLWDAAKGEPRATPKEHGDVVQSVAFSPDGKTLASGGGDGMVRLWDAAKGELGATFKGHEEGVWSVAFSSDGKTLASGGGDGMVRLWDAATGEPRATLKGHEEGVMSVAFSPDGKTLASGGRDKMVLLWDADYSKKPQAQGRSRDVK